MEKEDAGSSRIGAKSTQIELLQTAPEGVKGEVNESGSIDYGNQGRVTALGIVVNSEKSRSTVAREGGLE